ncbi:MAG: ABC transporter ATP-binding protein [Deltaproteobacteria bacterium]|nr:MAG: ABC transporter ATP-binding protein [Deltaproteobacteria bacterium]
MALIEFRGVQKAFGPKRVFIDLNLDIHEGESITIIGGSGMGKSVLLKLLIGLLETDGGSILFDGEQIVNASPKTLTKVRRRIGMLFQGAALFDSLSVGENVAYGLREHLQMSEEAIAERVHESLDSVGLPGIEDMWPADLSGGMKKRVGLARAIAVHPEVLLYDEPTTGLDPINVTRINRLILSLKEKLQVTSIVVTHDMQSAFITSDRLAMIDDGHVIFQGTPDEIRRTEDRRVRDFIEGNADEDLDTETLLRRGG